MSETSDYTPAHWAGHDFNAARAYYDANAGRSYAKAVASAVTLLDLLEVLKTDSPSPLIIISDVTGSMGEWPKVMFSKLPYLELEGQTYLGKDMEIAWMAVGDSFSDQYWIQARPFTKGTDLKDQLEKLVIEGGGGGTVHESYQAALFYVLHKVEMPKAVKPILIMIGDEHTYGHVSVTEAAQMGITISKSMSVQDIVAQLKKKMSVYLIRKPYEVVSGDQQSPIDKDINAEWAALLGKEFMAYLGDPKRVVDVIFGILAKETGRIDEFQVEIEDRQTKDQVDTVYKALKTIHNLAGGTKIKVKGALAGHSTMHKPMKGKKSGDLM